MYSVAGGCHLNFRFGDILRGHNKAGQPAGAIPSARMQLARLGQACSPIAPVCTCMYLGGMMHLHVPRREGGE